MVRHTAVDVPPGVCYGQADVGVADTFAEEAAAVSEALAGHDFDCAYSSPLRRCMMLARACGYAEPVVDDRLMEINFGDWEMRRWDDIDDPRLEEYYSDYEHVAATGGESFDRQRIRVRACLDEIADSVGRDAHVVVFTHGGVIAAAMMCAMGLTAAESFARQPRYGQMVTMEWSAT